MRYLSVFVLSRKSCSYFSSHGRTKNLLTSTFSSLSNFVLLLPISLSPYTKRVFEIMCWALFFCGIFQLIYNKHYNLSKTKHLRKENWYCVGSALTHGCWVVDIVGNLPCRTVWLFLLCFARRLCVGAKDPFICLLNLDKQTDKNILQNVRYQKGHLLAWLRIVN